MGSKTSTRVFVNTIAQYSKTIINVLLSLFSTRLILQALGSEDYGIYSLVGGIVAMLAFITNSLTVSTQRYISYYQGKNDVKASALVFNNSFFIHLFLGLIIFGVLEFVGLFLFDGYLNISEERLGAAYAVFHIVSFSLVISFLAAPYKALLIAHENIVYISLVEILDGILKLLIAVFLLYATWDKLVVYAILMLTVAIVNILFFAIYDHVKFEECIFPKVALFQKDYIKELSKFATWTMFGTACILGRTQGIAIVINKFTNAIVNAAYGIAFQVSSAILFVASSLYNAMNPQVMKAEAQGNRQRMLRLAEMESKFGFIFIAMVGIPCLFEMESLLSVWLGNVPEHAVFFCRMVVIASITDNLTYGLVTANQAIGDIKKFSIYINSIKLFALPIAIVYMLCGFSVHSVMYGYVFFELVAALARIPMLNKDGGLSIRHYVNTVFLKESLTILAIVTISYLCTVIFDFRFGFLVTFPMTIIVGVITAFYTALCNDEKVIVMGVISTIKGKLIKKRK